MDIDQLREEIIQFLRDKGVLDYNCRMLMLTWPHHPNEKPKRVEVVTTILEFVINRDKKQNPPQESTEQI